MLENLKKIAPEPIKTIYRMIMPAYSWVKDKVLLRPIARARYRKFGLAPYAGRAYRHLVNTTKIYTYQPLIGADERFFGVQSSSVRMCSDRWEAIQPALPTHGSAMDIGCQNGYFTFKMAQQGLVTIGVERDEPSYRICQLLSLANQVIPATFLQMEITEESVKGLPTVNVTLCVSVFHNWVREHGFEKADSIMRSLAERTKTALVFETGQNDQTGAYWSKDMEFMGDKPGEWIEQYMVELGFDKVKSLGKFFGTAEYDSDRHLYIAYKSNSGFSG